MSTFHAFLNAVVEGRSLTFEEAGRAFQIIMNDGATPAQMAAFLVALRIKGESAEEVAGAAQAMRVKGVHIKAPEGAIDLCGTGGDGKGLPNISTAAAFVVAGCGVPVAKHGNRSVSSRSGSADVLSALGVRVQMPPIQAEAALREAGITFLLAPVYHPAMRFVAPVRQELGLRSIFNIVGPLTNPAQVRRQLIGVYSRELARTVAEAGRLLGIERLWVVHSEDGLDELSINAATSVVMLDHGDITEREVTPEQAGLERVSLDAFTNCDATESARHIQNLLWGQDTPFRQVVVLNAAAALVVAGAAPDLAAGVRMAAQAIDSGKARHALEQLITFSQPDTAS